MTLYPTPFDSISNVSDSLSYDPALVEAVKSFQARHGLQSDGVIGEKTLRFMNQSFRDKAEVIALNMERIKWLPDNVTGNYISVNVPEYKLRVYDDQKQTLEMKVIVGASNKATPIFTDELEHIVFSPTWTVPTSIIKEEIIPNLRKDSLYYSKKNFLFFKNDEEIDPIAEYWSDANINPYQYRVIQNPGTDNSLGSVKFMMPNNMSVYLHDTPNHRLFLKDYRALSHGCVRLDEPAKFAEYLLRDQKGWTPERIVKAMNESSPFTIHLKKHYQVNIEYCTAWVDDNGVINFREDIYGHDKAQLKQLKPARIADTASIGN
jgi:murein L,D-transpeptidase YcbB/YkuD